MHTNGATAFDYAIVSGIDKSRGKISPRKISSRPAVSRMKRFDLLAWNQNDYFAYRTNIFLSFFPVKKNYYPAREIGSE